MFVRLDERAHARPLTQDLNRKGRKEAAKNAKNSFAHFAVLFASFAVNVLLFRGEPGPRSVYTNCRLSRRSRSMASSFLFDIWL